MMDALEFWPFDMAPGPGFLGFYLVFASGFLWAGVLLARALADGGGRSALAEEAEGQVPAAPPYRQAGTRERLSLGWIPLADELWPIAYLRGGRVAVIEALLCTATAAGWIVNVGDSQHVSVGGTPPSDPLLAKFYGSLTTVRQPQVSQEVARAAAWATADNATDELRAELEAAGLLRSARARRRGKVIVATVGAFVLLVGFLRVVRGVALNHHVGFLLLEIVVTTMAVVVYARRAGREAPSRAGRRYLQWLDATTTSLRRDVATGRRTAPLEVGLAVAAAGATTVIGAPLFLGLSTFLVPPTPVAQSDGSSGCSSSSCGGGGGCGGGCGGGGCGG
jgi:uncharacterized protein (TIGR04222 family)